MKSPTLLALALLLSLTACGGGDTDADAAPAEAGAPGGGTASAQDIDCPPLQVTIDGEPVSGLDHALAVAEAGSYGVEVFNHPEATCADLLAPSRNVPPGEVNVRAYAQEGTSQGSVSIGSKTNFAPGVELVEKTDTPGELVAICVEGATWTSGGFGDDAGQTYEIRGLFAGEYCGERG